MFARTKFWLLINIYAIILDCIGVFGLAIAFLHLRTWPVAAISIGIVASLVLYGGIGIHTTYEEKCRIYLVLLKRNAVVFHLESFRDFMSVPCHRMVVRMVLHRLRIQHQYAVIKQTYYAPPWKRRFADETKLYVFKSKEEGDQWLLQQRNKLA